MLQSNPVWKACLVLQSLRVPFHFCALLCQSIVFFFQHTAQHKRNLFVLLGQKSNSMLTGNCLPLFLPAAKHKNSFWIKGRVCFACFFIFVIAVSNAATIKYALNLFACVLRLGSIELRKMWQLKHNMANMQQCLVVCVKANAFDMFF